MAGLRWCGVATRGPCVIHSGSRQRIAAGLAPLIVGRFIWPAKGELCGAWGGSLNFRQVIAARSRQADPHRVCMSLKRMDKLVQEILLAMTPGGWRRIGASIPLDDPPVSCYD
jgi:hypothetical protein